MALLEVNNLKIYYPLAKKSLFSNEPQKYVKAVDNVSFKVEQGNVLGIVGESGCGKSSLAKGIMRLTPVMSGEILLDGVDILSLNRKNLKKERKNFQMIFQDPEASLNPRLTVGEIIAEPLQVYENLSKKELRLRVQELMSQVGLSPYMIRRYPHEFSGGQRQRICIARSLSLKPKLMVCDEAVSALDVSIQSQIINLLNELKEELGLTYLFISHDLAVTRYISDQIMVMYLGKTVEFGKTEDVMMSPTHPYTKALISAVPQYKKEEESLMLEGEIPSPINPPSGCPFNTRCPIVQNKCLEKMPPLEIKEGHQQVACFEVKA
ncbi:MAG: peptide ABC transporter substrate-binding protein [Halobacteriovoraceae bacterium]|nr:peptide ABC transporter substrate-binding protein [Halobacteriovoraceae bacterium]|tara:strand:- start:695 stop:1660 length:966 start_codon:yes stop_codon:yes gene_type:complete